MSKLKELLAELGELNQENIGSWPDWAHYSALAVVSVIILLVGSWYFVLPQNSILKQQANKETTLKDQYALYSSQVGNLNPYQEQLNKINRQFGELLKQLPTRSEIPALLHDISKIRKDSGLEEELFRPAEAIQKDFYTILPNKLTVVGKYHDLASFSSKLAALPRIVTIKDIEIAPVQSKQSNNLLRLSMTINTYRYTGSSLKGKQ